ncbi:hypothetical protein PAXRUDRAFT_22593 [Paxillus rubicundulus Ve08.2h10]|uniref:Uncharacterized protein n=1 Tax=Paxillus rubicundulus Ve08.2h10 TaxID=930991 RepID=A0A0D0BJY1_9AGAM|nr:hypothetical protein PAXRUDRAFT_22593 [Paxillus rubicundulus Ve08.2h10]
MDIVAAIGKFHLSAHKLECYPQFSSNFMEGAGQMDGEIIETLWAPLNKIAPSARAMLSASLLNAPISVLTVSAVNTLLKKHNIGQDKIRKLPDEESEALRLQGEHLDIYATKAEKGV